eukprot:1144680-Pelagomonas_calceolata.AAC.2
MLGAVYINPVSQRSPVQAATDSSLLNETAHVTQVSPHVLLCGDLNAKIGKLREHAHSWWPSDGTPCPAPRKCKFPGVNAAGRLSVELANICELVLGTGRVRGDDGKRTCLGHDAGVHGSRPDHILMSDRFFAMADCVHITEDRTISDHCPISIVMVQVWYQLREIISI